MTRDPGVPGTSQSHPDIAGVQGAFHDADFDYDPGSPHLRHPQIRQGVIRDLDRLVSERIAARGECHVIEIGAGHGTFTESLLNAGARVTVTEASRASADLLEERYAGDERVTVLFDHTGQESLHIGREFDLAVCVSVLHHIPEYLPFVAALVAQLSPGGGFYSVQDPLYYPRQPKRTMRSQAAAYFVWRLGRGNYVRGLKTRIRRARGRYSDTEASDLVEYHVVRRGVDEQALLDLLSPSFETVDVFTYWSTQAPVLQRLGQATSMTTTFGIRATGKR